jgi:hypothetical protein
VRRFTGCCPDAQRSHDLIPAVLKVDHAAVITPQDLMVRDLLAHGSVSSGSRPRSGEARLPCESWAVFRTGSQLFLFGGVRICRGLWTPESRVQLLASPCSARLLLRSMRSKAMHVSRV